MAKIAVVGAGITGVTTAYALMARGHDVTVIEAERYVAMETSFANGGQLSASNAEVWNSWSTILKGIKWMFRADAPLLMNPRPTYHKLSWMTEFVLEMRHYRENTIETTRLALAARQHLLDIARAEGIDFDLEQRGILHFYADAPAFRKAEMANALLREGGLDRYAVTPLEMRSIEPSLRGSFYGGFYTPSDFTGDVHKYSRGLGKACLSHGVTFMHDSCVTAIDTDGAGVRLQLAVAEPACPASTTVFEADAVVVCAGVGSRRLAAMVGDRINIYPVKGYSITVCLDDEQAQLAAPYVSLLDEEAKIVTSRLGSDRFRVAGTAEFNGYNKDIRADRIKPLIDWSERYFPDMSTGRVIPWAGLRPMMPNMMPRVGRGKRPGIFYNTGHGHLGWTLSAATAQLVGDMVDGQFAERQLV